MADVPDTNSGGVSPRVPVVSVIIPARNEEQSIRACLESLVAQAVKTGGDTAERSVLVTADGLGYEIIVIDDGSTDHTSAIARQFTGLRLINADPLAPGWTGKCNACATGARHARGAWFLFTDADTVHKPGSLTRSLAEAQLHLADMLSYSPEQKISGLAQHALMPLVFAELALTYRPREVCDPCSPVAAANGQFLLINRPAYEAIGGHAAVSADLLEDVALARRAKQAGYRIRFRYGGDLVSTRMYRNLAQMREGWTKNLALLFPSTEKLAFRRALEFASIFGLAMLGAVAVAFGAFGLAFLASAVVLLALGRFYSRVRKAHFGTFSTLLSPLGLPFFSYLLLRSRISHKKGTVAWKGREYPGSAGSVEPQLSEKTRLSGASNG